MINGQNCSDQPVKNYLRTNNKIRKMTICQGDDYTTVCYRLTIIISKIVIK